MRAVNTIRGLRLERKLTQFELALKVGVHPQAVYLWESGRRTPQVPQLRKLGEVFGLCSDDIVLGSVGDPADVDRAPRQPRASRRPGESAPGRSRSGRVATRGGRAPAAASDDP